MSLHSLPRHHGALLGVFEGSPAMPGETDVKCPICGDHSPPVWQVFETRMTHGYVAELPGAQNILEQVGLDWMRCSNEECEQLIVRVHEQRVSGVMTPLLRTDSWIARPRFGETARPIHELVPEPFRTDHAEAAAILALSPRMSAVLSRRILADLLERYAKLDAFSLKDRIDAFVADTSHPQGLRENLRYLAEIGNFGAHTQTNDQAEIVDVETDEAEWTLTLVERLLDYFVVTPEGDRKMRKTFDEKLKNANRRPIVPPPAEESS